MNTDRRRMSERERTCVATVTFCVFCIFPFLFFFVEFLCFEIILVLVVSCVASLWLENLPLDCFGSISYCTDLERLE